MLVPEASMNENHFAPSRKNQVRLSGQTFTVEPEAIALAVKYLAQENFGRRVFGPYLPHVIAAALRTELVHTACLVRQQDRAEDRKYP
jgi:hypothetical protein